MAHNAADGPELSCRSPPWQGIKLIRLRRAFKRPQANGVAFFRNELARALAHTRSPAGGRRRPEGRGQPGAADMQGGTASGVSIDGVGAPRRVQRDDSQRTPGGLDTRRTGDSWGSGEAENSFRAVLPPRTRLIPDQRGFTRPDTGPADSLASGRQGVVSFARYRADGRVTQRRDGRFTSGLDLLPMAQW